jgi:hypothetical protein
MGGSHLPNPTPLNPEARKVRNQDHSQISHGAKTLKEINVKTNNCASLKSVITINCHITIVKISLAH